jgi:Glyoxalase-like domain
MAIGFQVSFDAHDPAALARFWALALDYVEQPPPDGFATWEEFAERMNIPKDRWNDFGAVVDPAGVGPRLFFQKVPEGKTAKNRVHLDVNVSAPDRDWSKVTAHAEKLVSAGATLVEERQDQTSHWIVMLDPEGNELCLQ